MLKHVFLVVVARILYFLFVYLPYCPVRRIGSLPKQAGVILAPTHANFFSDICTVTGMVPRNPKWLAKASLFKGFGGSIMRWLGGYPLVRRYEARHYEDKGKSTNEQSITKVAEHLQEGDYVCIFPEGNSYERPGLELPLKSGIAYMGFAAEAAHNFTLNLVVQPIGIEYGDLKRMGSGMTVRLCQPIELRNYADEYRQSEKAAVMALMKNLTMAYKEVYPHFETKEEFKFAQYFSQIGLGTRMQWSQLFTKQRKKLATGWDEWFTDKVFLMKSLQEHNGAVDLYRASYWWQNSSFGEKFITIFKVIALSPFALHGLVHCFLADQFSKLFVDKITKDPVEYMTVRVGLNLFSFPFFSWLQFYILFSNWVSLGFFMELWFYLSYLLANIFCFLVWLRWWPQYRLLMPQHWLRNTKSGQDLAAKLNEVIHKLGPLV